MGPLGEIVVEKNDRRWQVRGNAPRLAIYDLDHSFSDESAFRDALSGYLLSESRLGEKERSKQ